MKKILSLLLVLSLVAGLAACGSKDSTNNPADTSEPQNGSQPQTASIPLTIWTDFTPRSEEAFRASLDSFVAENPQYIPEFEVFPGADRAQKLALAKQSNSLPTLMFAASFTMMDYAHQGTILPITEIIEPILSDYPQHIMDASSINGEYYMFPVYQSPFLLFYNADIFREAGLEEYITESPDIPAQWVFDDFVNVILPTLKEKMAGTEKYPMALFAGNDQADTNSHSWLRMYGGTVFKDGRVVAGEDENTIKALDTLSEWVQKGYTNSDAATKLGTECLVDFQNQLVAISWGNQINFENLQSSVKNGTMADFDFRVALVPKKDSQTMAMYYYGGFLMKTDDNQIEGGLKYLSWLAQQKDGVYKDLSLMCMPCSISILESVADERPIYQEYLNLSEYVYDFTGGVPGYVETRSLFFPALQSKLSGAQSSAEALKDYTEKANEIIDTYVKNSVVLSK